MNPIDSIQKLIKKAVRPDEARPETGGTGPAPEFAPEEYESLQEIIDGMGAGTARIIIDREAGKRLAEDYRLDDPQNKGRYYVAKVFHTGGRLMAELIVDKQNGRVQFLGPRKSS